MRPGTPWFGHVNMLVYGLTFNRPIEDSVVATRAESVVLERGIRPRDALFESASAALSAGEQITDGEFVEGREEYARDYLQRLVQALEARQPWPELAVTALDNAEFAALKDAPEIGEIPLDQIDVRDRLPVPLSPLPGDGRHGAVLRLRGGQVVALVAPVSFAEKGVKLLARTDDPAGTVAAFRELTGLEVTT